MKAPWPRIAAVLAGALLAAAGCGSPEGEPKTISISGSSTIAPLMTEIGKRFEAIHPGVRVDVQTGGSSRGIADARQGLADIGASSRELDASESPGLTTFLLARDGVCFLIHKSNPVASLTDDQLRDIFTGRITNWRGVGGPDAPITVINRADGRSEVELVTLYLGIEAKDIKAQLVAGDNEQGMKSAESDPHSIIYMSVGTSEYHAARGGAVKPLPLRGVPATAATIADGTYPLVRPLLLVTRRPPEELVRKLIDFARSESSHDLIERFSFVPAES